MVDVAAHRESNRRHYQNKVKQDVDLMEVRRQTALAYYYTVIRPLKEQKTVKKVKIKEPVRTLFIENKKVLLFFG